MPNLNKKWSLFAGAACCFVYACSGDEDGEPDVGSGGSIASTGGADPGGSSAGGTNPGGSDQGTDPRPTNPFGSCAPSSFGTTVARGTCNRVHNFEGEDGFADFNMDTDGRLGAGFGVPLSGQNLPISGGRGFDGASESGSGSLTIVEDGANGTNHAVRFSFADAIEWGGAFWLALNDEGCYDASAYDGVSFWAKAAPESRKNILFMVSTADSNPSYDCVKDCWGHSRRTFTLTDEWKKYEVTWDTLVPPEWSSTKYFDEARTLGLVFSDAGFIPMNNITFFIDEIEFFGGDNSECLPLGMGGGAGAGMGGSGN